MADDEPAAGPQAFNQTRHHLLLGLRLEVDHHVAQQDDIELADLRQTLVQVDLLEAHALAHGVLQRELSGLVADAFQAIGLEIGGRNFTGLLHGIKGGAGLFQDLCADIRTKHLPRRIAQLISQQHGQAVGLLAARAGRAPYPEGPSGGALPQHALAQEVEMLLLAEEMGLVGGEQVDCHLQFILALADQLEVILVAAQAVVLQPLRQASRHQSLLGRRHADAGDAVNHLPEVGELVIVQGGVEHGEVRRTNPRRVDRRLELSANLRLVRSCSSP